MLDPIRFLIRHGNITAAVVEGKADPAGAPVADGIVDGLLGNEIEMAPRLRING